MKKTNNTLYYNITPFKQSDRDTQRNTFVSASIKTCGLCTEKLDGSGGGYGMCRSCHSKFQSGYFIKKLKG